tara:strand:- start:228 stop:425 length:198 start_codon:yes stop_codon:yes gene_type:complete
MPLEDCGYRSRGKGVLSTKQERSQLHGKKVAAGFPDEKVNLFSVLSSQIEISQVTERPQAEIAIE